MVRPMKDSDWPRVAEIYTRGLEGGRSIFHTDCPTFARWDAGSVLPGTNSACGRTLR